jgi:hypothetical protein
VTSKPLRFHPQAEQEYLTALAWYRERSLIAAINFESTFEQAVRRIRESPQRWPVYVADFRKYTLRQFPRTLHSISPIPPLTLAMSHGEDYGHPASPYSRLASTGTTGDHACGLSVCDLDGSVAGPGLENREIWGTRRTILPEGAKGMIAVSIKSNVFEQMIADQKRETPQAVLDAMARRVGASSAKIESIATAALPLEFLRLRDSADFYQDECYRAERSGAYFSACIMAAAAVDCLLRMLAFLYEDEILESGTYRNRKNRHGEPSVNQLELNELIQLSANLNWIPKGLITHEWRDYLKSHRDFLTRLIQSGNERSRRLPDDPGLALVRFLQGVRNCIHGDRFVRTNASPNRKDLDCACKVALLAYEELKETLLAQIMRDFRKIKRVRSRP